ncbi:hypothetical protein JTE90_001250 [Oedothorax gibbosus]|uniref:Uncharacterized protein n=1 Tax=Oedothorax gibbosus TaxID=931172 RepID=A0AAV6VW19_9ARAC|nr:hypothetical protein JTE90_001250 [Oedothorax gibbosus]
MDNLLFVAGKINLKIRDRVEDKRRKKRRKSPSKTISIFHGNSRSEGLQQKQQPGAGEKNCRNPDKIPKRQGSE